MKITRIEPLKCPLCNSFRVTRSDEKLVTCSDCKRTTGYKKPNTESEVKQQETHSQSGSIRPSVLAVLMAIPITFAVYSTNFMQENEAHEQATSDAPSAIGDCFTWPDERSISCDESLPKWEQDDDTAAIKKIVEVGVNKVRIVWNVYDCNMEPTNDSYYLDVYERSDLDRYVKVSCPKDLADVRIEE